MGVYFEVMMAFGLGVIYGSKKVYDYIDKCINYVYYIKVMILWDV